VSRSYIPFVSSTIVLTIFLIFGCIFYYDRPEKTIPFSYAYGVNGTLLDLNTNTTSVDVPTLWKIALNFTTKDDANNDPRLYYYYAELNSDYTIQSWSSGPDGGALLINEDAIGATLYDSSKRLVAVPHFVIDQFRLQLVEFEGTSIGYTQMKWGPIDDVNSFEDGVGAGEAVDFAGVGSQDFPDMIYMYIDANVAYWHTEYDSRLNSHP
jgi:hypothetical protein